MDQNLSLNKCVFLSFLLLFFASQKKINDRFFIYRNINDIALIKLKSKNYVSKKKVLPMCKKSYYKDKAASLYAVGMGLTQANTYNFPKQLQKIKLKETQGNCHFGTFFRGPKKQVCTQPTDKNQSQATCQGTSFFLSPSSHCILFKMSLNYELKVKVKVIFQNWNPMRGEWKSDIPGLTSIKEKCLSYNFIYGDNGKNAYHTIFWNVYSSNFSVLIPSFESFCSIKTCFWFWSKNCLLEYFYIWYK